VLKRDRCGNRFSFVGNLWYVQSLQCFHLRLNLTQFSSSRRNRSYEPTHWAVSIQLELFSSLWLDDFKWQSIKIIFGVRGKVQKLFIMLESKAPKQQLFQTNRRHSLVTEFAQSYRSRWRERDTDESQDCVKRHRWMTVSKSLLKLEMMNSEGNDYKLPERYVGEQILMTGLKLSQMFQGRIVPDSKILQLLFVFDVKFYLFNINRQNSLTLNIK